jgi:integrase
MTIKRERIPGMAPRRVYHVPEALEDYGADLRTLGLAASTVKGYSGYLARFGRVCDEVAKERGKHSPLTVEEIDPRVISRYFASSTGEQGNLNNMLVPVRLFLAWCVAAGWLETGAVTRLLGRRKTKAPVRKPKHYIPPERFDEMLEAPSLQHPSERMVVAAALFTLCRRSEIAGLQLRHIDLAAGVLRVYRGKRSRWTDVGICPELGEELNNWLGYYAFSMDQAGPHFMMADHPDWKLIPRLKHRRTRDDQGRIIMSGQIDLDPAGTPIHLERIIKRVLDDLGVESVRDGRQVKHLGEGCHTVRRSGARAMLDHLSKDLGHERALLQVATMLDHDDPKQTLLYIGMDQEREELNTWLRSNSMYGAPKRPGNVVPIRRTA